MANILIVHAHHEPRSFSSALARTAAETLAAQGHEVSFSDLYALGFDPVSDRRNFVTTADADYLKQQAEEDHASGRAGFVPEIEAEMRKVEACDLLMFSFPLWWFGMPAILKGWVDRVLAHGRMYGQGRWYESGFGHGKRAMAVMTTGGGAAAYGTHGLNPSLEEILTPIHHGIFWFNGISPLPPFVAWSAAHGTDKDRHQVLEAWRARLGTILEEVPLELPRARDFDPETLVDTWSRFMVTLRRKRRADEGSRGGTSEPLTGRLEMLRREGRVLEVHTAPWEAADWRGFVLFRERGEEAVAAACRKLAPEGGLDFEIVRLGDGM